MKLIGKSNKLIVFLVLTLTYISCYFSFNNTSNNTIINHGEIKTFLKVSNVKNITFKDKYIVLNKITLGIKEKVLFDIDNNNEININDLYIAKDIINKKIKFNNNDLTYLKKHINEDLSSKYDLNYDNKVDDLDVNLLHKYLSGVINLDFNNDKKVDLEDINILHLYINTRFYLNLLVPEKTDSSSLTFSYDKSIIDLNNGNVIPKKEGITTLKVIDSDGNYDACYVVVVDLDKKEKNFSFNEDVIYIKPSYLTTVMKSNGDINKDGKINVLDYLILKDIINYTFGDLNNSGVVDSGDIKKLENYIEENRNSITFFERYDINRDGYINDKDLDLLRAYLSNIKIGDINKDTMVEDRDIKIINEYSESYYNTTYTIDKAVFNKNIDYRVNKPGIIDVDDDGVIYGLKEGEVILEGITKNGLKDSIRVIVSNNNKLPTNIKSFEEKINLKYFDYNNLDIFKFDFNNDGFIDNEDLNIAKNIIEIKPTFKDLESIIGNINNKEYNKKYDLNNDKSLNNKDILIVYFYLNSRKDGDINGDKSLNDKDISLYNDYMASKKKIKASIDFDSINSIYYYSFNNNIVSVDSTGILTSKNRGTTYVSLLTVNGINDKVLIEVK